MEKFNSIIKTLLNYISLPTLIIGGFWMLVILVGTLNDLSLPIMLGDGIRRFGRWGLLTLAMVPAIKSGTGPNFALPIGVVCGLLGMVCSIVMGLSDFSWIFVSAVLAVFFAAILGFIYGKLMNAVKGSEMAIATYTGFSITVLFCILWLVFPFRDPRITWPLGAGVGLRQIIQLDNVNGAFLLDNFLAFEVFGIFIPSGMLLVFFTACFLVWLFTRSKMGIAITAAGANPIFAAAAGLDVDKGRIIANMISTTLGALGIIVYAQSFGFAQLYLDPLMMAFPAVAAILIGGASVTKARIIHVLVGALIFQGLMATTLPVANELFAGTDLSETLRMIIQNGVILYALMQGGSRK